MFEPGQRVGVAVSGGADSVCLLHVLRGTGAALEPARCAVLHLNHGLRGEESREDAAFVGRARRAPGAALSPRERGRARRWPSTTTWNRPRGEARLRFFRRLIAAGAVDRVALGHTRSDQAETVLFRFLRGVGHGGPGRHPAGDRRGAGAAAARRRSRSEVEAYLRGARHRLARGLHQRRPRLRPQPHPPRAAAAAGAGVEPGASGNAGQHGRLGARTRRPTGRPRSTGSRAGHLTRTAGRCCPASECAAGRCRWPPPAAWCAGPSSAVKGDLRGRSISRHVEAILALAAGGEGHGRLQVPGAGRLCAPSSGCGWRPPGVATLANRNYRLPLPVPGRAGLPGGTEIATGTD